MNTIDTTNKQVLKAMKDMMDKTASKSTFTLHELKDNGLVYISHFSEKSNAKTYARKYADESSTIYIYESRCIRVYDPVTDEMKPDVDMILCDDDLDTDYTPETDLSNMTLWTYGKGYILEPQEDSDYYGEKYFHNGWWNESQKGWFFKEENYEWLQINGAINAEEEFIEEDEEEFIEEDEEDDDEFIEEDDEIELENENDYDYSEMTIRTHGKGFLLMPPKSHELYGEKYLCNGWWIPSQKGWFFKTEYKEWLDSCGTKSVKTSKVDKDLTGMSLEIYGKGYILKTIKKDKRFGIKYFMNGFWNKTQEGWFFQSKYYDELISMGATLIKTEHEVPEDSMVLTSSITEDEFEYLHDDTEFMTNDNIVVPKFVKYGKGWILKANEHYKYNENKYLEGGWWVPSIKGWFFKNKAKKDFMNKYFDI